MINKRKLDEVIEIATDAPEEHCGYTFEDYVLEPFYQEHVCGYVRTSLMPEVLADYLYKDCYYDDLETLKANLNYVNIAMNKGQFYKKWWVDITLDTVLEKIEKRKQDDEAKYAEMSIADISIFSQKK